MMTLTELLQYREYLQDHRPTGGQYFVESQIDPLMHYVSASLDPQLDHITGLKDIRDRIMTDIRDLTQHFDSIDAWVGTQVELHQKSLLTKSYSLYESMMEHDTPEYILDRRIAITDEHRDFVISRLLNRSSWQHCAMILRPGRESWIEHMVVFDPLYVVDHHPDLLVPAQAMFNQVYRNRVRWCVTKETDLSGMLHMIPDAQIDFCFAWNFFHYKPFEVFRAYLNELYQKLAAGGTLAFTFNDGDRSGGAANAERSWMCYVPGSMIMTFAETLGFSVSLVKHFDRSTTWLELRKPGTRSSIKGGQTLAKVFPRTNTAAKTIDIEPEHSYTTDERETLIQQAIDLNIDTPHRIRQHYSTEKLRTIIRKRKSQ